MAPQTENGIDENLQVEKGNFTRIVNPLLDNLIKIPFKGCEVSVAIYIIRKTYGFNKTEDEISLSQFCKDLDRSKQTIVTALKNLQLVNIARLVKKGDSRNHSNIWSINKYYKSWKLVNTARLVKRKRGTSLTEASQLVQTARHTKDNTKNITKDISAAHDKKFDIETYPREHYIKITDEYQSFKGIKLQGGEYLPVLKEIKLMFKNGRTVEQITETMEICEDNYPDWSMNTVRMKIADVVGGKLTSKNIIKNKGITITRRIQE